MSFGFLCSERVKGFRCQGLGLHGVVAVGICARVDALHHSIAFLFLLLRFLARAGEACCLKLVFLVAEQVTFNIFGPT